MQCFWKNCLCNSAIFFSAKDKQNNNQKNASSQKSPQKNSQPRNSGSSPTDAKNNIDACSGEGISVATKTGSDGLTSEPAVGIQSAVWIN